MFRTFPVSVAGVVINTVVVFPTTAAPGHRRAPTTQKGIKTADAMAKKMVTG
ncbi:MAG: hypothetical protein ING66_11780 [Rhodocyclaceae bacterium]|nr:hypothetical protein [Rhodocyclaceae bacterium]MCE2722491.1 hypothetical protein [Betaproteobacteria bacterium]MCA3018133.1 hypothetical protein [Rhodocyclaceae bacterium]MCA3023073.1 hypothetical protein [Rhodocyclaceae bacterium]MCA3026430.1 hypothetical protein [Rhodocyclaceae bacterium]